MTETLDRAEQPDTSIVSNSTRAADPSRRSGLLFRAAAWVGIVAGAVFIVGSVFMTGFILGHHGGHGGHGGGGRGHWHQMSSTQHDGSRRGHPQWTPGPDAGAGGASTQSSGNAPTALPPRP